MSPKKILIVSGEPSGDLHASNLVKDLKTLDPNLKFFGLGGNLSKKAGVDVIFDISELAIIGIAEVFKHLSTIRKIYAQIIDRIESEKPDLAILVDYPGFNLRLAKALKRRNIPVIYYISPQIWAWGMDRIATIKACVVKMIVFFKFEEELYKLHGVDAEFVGHPLLDAVKVTASKDQTLKKYDLSPGKTKIAILPGSRKTEIARILPTLISACSLIDKELGGAQFIIAKHRDLELALYKDAIGSSDIDVKIAEGDTHNVIEACDFAIVTSGTATLETAILGRPLIVVYKTSFVTAWAYRLVRQTKLVGLVNIIADKVVVPELLQERATPEKIASAALSIILDDKNKALMIEGLKNVASSLGMPGASQRAAKAILPYLK